MRNFPGLPPGGVPPIGDAAGEALLGGRLPPADAEGGLRPLAEAIAALTVAPSARELAGEREARATYHAGFRPARGARGRRRRIRLAASVLSVKLAAAAAVAAGGLTAAAYADVLPAPVQSLRAPHPAGARAAPAPGPGPGPGSGPAGDSLRPRPARPGGPWPAEQPPGRPAVLTYPGGRRQRRSGQPPGPPAAPQPPQPSDPGTGQPPHWQADQATPRRPGRQREAEAAGQAAADRASSRRSAGLA